MGFLIIGYYLFILCSLSGDPVKLHRKLKSLPFGRWVFTQGISLFAPYTGIYYSLILFFLFLIFLLSCCLPPCFWISSECHAFRMNLHRVLTRPPPSPLSLFCIFSSPFSLLLSSGFMFSFYFCSLLCNVLALSSIHCNYDPRIH